jgi:acetyltransferase
MTRLAVQPDRQSGEAAIVVGDPWQDKGLGTAMFDYILEVGKDMGLKKIFSEVLSENTKMKHILFTRGFDIKPIDEETYLATIEL